MRTFVYRDSAGLWRWRCVAGNGDIVADSGQGYTRAHDARRARRRARYLLWMAPVETLGSEDPT